MAGQQLGWSEQCVMNSPSEGSGLVWSPKPPSRQPTPPTRTQTAFPPVLLDLVGEQ